MAIRLTLGAIACLALHASVSHADASSNYTSQLLSSGTVNLGDWQDAYNKAAAFAKSLTTSEKISYITGGSAGSMSVLNKLDSSTNPINYYFVTTWPAGMAMSMTWDSDAIYGQGEALGEEYRAKGINMMFGPTSQPLGRSAWGGRTGESYGSDSYLNGIMTGTFVKGVSKSGVIASAKHYILNEQETNRQGSMGGGMGPGGAAPQKRQASNSTLTNSTSSSSGAYDVTIGDKAFHETYLAPFYDAVKNGMGGAMCAMNKVNGSYSCENQDLLAKYLKTELGFPGLVSGDAGAQHTSINSANAGMDFGSSSYWSNSILVAGMANGSFTEARLYDMVIRNVIGYYHLGQDADYPAHASATDFVDARGNHSALARQYAVESIALLKNDNSALPLKDRRSISIFGAHAGPRYVGPNTGLSVMGGEDPTYPGHLAQAYGSAMGSFAYLVTPLHAMTERAMKDGFMLRWWLQDEATSSTSSGMGGIMISDGAGTELTETVAGVASNSDACIVYMNAYAGEGADRSELYNATQDNLVTTVAETCNNTIVVINTPGPRLVDAWVENENVTAILYGGMLGQASGYAINDVLFGDVNPSGRLVHTIAKNESDYDQGTVISETHLELDFSEGNYVDYKYFNAHNKTPRYEFGFGMSYTSFEYSSEVGTQVDAEKLSNRYASGILSVGGRADLWDVVASVSTEITNTGTLEGADVAQLYIAFPSAADEPVRQLRGFKKVSLQPGEKQTVAFDLRRRDLSVWDVAAQEWKVEAGEYVFYVARSSRDLKAHTSITL